MYKVSINKNVFGKYNIIQTTLKFKSKKRKEKFYWIVNDKKLSNNVSRAKTTLMNIVNYNKFYYFYTQTISSVYSRSDLDSFVKKFNQIVRDIRKKHKDLDFYYVFVPEYHSDGQNWHLHGFLSEGFKIYSYINKNGFYNLSCFDKLGFNSVSIIRNYEACIKYSLKYITKDLAISFKKGQRIVYASKGLLRSNIVKSGSISQVLPVHFDFRNEYCLKTTIPLQKYYKMVTDIDKIFNVSYYDFS